MNSLLADILSSGALAVIGVVGGFASKYFNRKGNKAAAEEDLAHTQKIQTDIENNKSLAENVVRAVEKRFGSETAVVKFDKALEFLINDAEVHGITISKDNALSLIEGALKKLENEFGANWSENKPVTPAQ